MEGLYLSSVGVAVAGTRRLSPRADPSNHTAGLGMVGKVAAYCEKSVRSKVDGCEIDDENITGGAI